MSSKKSKKSTKDYSGNNIFPGHDNVFQDTAGNITYLPKFFAQTSEPTSGMNKGDRWTNISNMNSIKEYWYDGASWQNYK
jgi:hypothetical protein